MAHNLWICEWQVIQNIPVHYAVPLFWYSRIATSKVTVAVKNGNGLFDFLNPVLQFFISDFLSLLYFQGSFFLSTLLFDTTPWRAFHLSIPLFFHQQSTRNVVSKRMNAWSVRRLLLLLFPRRDDFLWRSVSIKAPIKCLAVIAMMKNTSSFLRISGSIEKTTLLSRDRHWRLSRVQREKVRTATTDLSHSLGLFRQFTKPAHWWTPKSAFCRPAKNLHWTNFSSLATWILSALNERSFARLPSSALENDTHSIKLFAPNPIQQNYRLDARTFQSPRLCLLNAWHKLPEHALNDRLLAILRRLHG